MILFTMGVKSKNLSAVRFSALFAVAGILLSRVNVNLIAFNWNLPNHFPSLYRGCHDYGYDYTPHSCLQVDTEQVPGYARTA